MQAGSPSSSRGPARCSGSSRLPAAFTNRVSRSKFEPSKDWTLMWLLFFLVSTLRFTSYKFQYHGFKLEEKHNFNPQGQLLWQVCVDMRHKHITWCFWFSNFVVIPKSSSSVDLIPNCVFFQNNTTPPRARGWPTFGTRSRSGSSRSLFLPAALLSAHPAVDPVRVTVAITVTVPQNHSWSWFQLGMHQYQCLAWYRYQGWVLHSYS